MKIIGKSFLIKANSGENQREAIFISDNIRGILHGNHVKKIRYNQMKIL